MARTLWYRLAGTTAWTSASGLAGDIALVPGSYEVHDGVNLYSGTVTAASSTTGKFDFSQSANSGLLALLMEAF